MRSSLRAFAAAVLVAATTSVVVASTATPASAVCSPFGWEWHTVYSGPFGHLQAPVPNEFNWTDCPDNP